MSTGNEWIVSLTPDSACTVMHSSVARELGIATVVANMVARVTIAIQNTKADVDSFVVPDEYTRQPLIVGRNFILQDHVITIKHGNRLIFNEIPTLGRKQVATTWDVGVCDVVAKIKLRFGEIEERARLKCVALIDEFRCYTSSSTRDLGKTDATALEIKCATGLSPRGAGEMTKELKKKTGNYRMCVDRRNVITMKDRYPLPLIDDQIDKLGSHKYFMDLDLSRYISDKMEFKLGFARIVNYLQLCSLFIWKAI